MKINEELKKQAEVVESRLNYHFLKTDGTYDVPKNLPFMNEFLKDIKKLCSLTEDTSNQKCEHEWVHLKSVELDDFVENASFYCKKCLSTKVVQLDYFKHGAF